MIMRNFPKAIVDLETLTQSENSSEVKNMLDKAQASLERAQSNNYYDILDIEAGASHGDIKKAYKKLALVHHPDKHSDAPPDERSEQQEIFKRIGNAYEVLSNPQKKAKYDRDSSNNNNNNNHH